MSYICITKQANKDNIMQELVFTTGIAGHTDTLDKLHLFIIGIDCRRRAGQIPVTKITFGYKGVSSFVKVPADLIDMVFNAEVLKNHGVINPSWDKDDKECNMIQSIHYSFNSPDGCAAISYFAKDRRTVTNTRIKMDELINAGFLNFDSIEGNFWNHINQQ